MPNSSHQSDSLSTTTGGSPYRADHVGSLLRPAKLRQARAACSAGALTTEALREVENICIAEAIHRQEQLGLRMATDGEYRRSYFHFDFLSGLDGVELYERNLERQSKGRLPLRHAARVTGRIRWARPVMVDDFRFVADHVSTALPKMTIPSPNLLHFRGGRAAIDATAYPDLDEFFADLGNAYQAAIAEFGAAGCRYLQLDDVSWAMLCDPVQRAALEARGERVDQILRRYADLINVAIAGKPPGMMVSIHLCRGNFQSSWAAAGGYEPIADTLFNTTQVDAYFLEYDSDRAGGFEPLRFVPHGKAIVLGLVTSKTGALEAKGAVTQRIGQAAKWLPLDQLALSPQCGFASTEEGNLLTEEEQWAKLRLCVEVAQEVWGAA